MTAIGLMRVLERSIYRGPNLYGMRPMIRIRLNLGALEDWPTDHLAGFADALLAILPGLEKHGCSYRVPGGFVRRMRDGTWIGHVIEHVAIELLSLAGAAVTRGKTRSVKGRPGVYDILYRYADDASGIAAGRAAIELVAHLLPGELAAVQGLDLLGEPIRGEIDDVVAALRRLVMANGFGPSTQAIVAEAHRRGIPVTRLNDASLVQLGHGSRQRRIRASVTGATSLIGAELAGHKDAAKALLHDAGLPVPRGSVVRSADDAVRVARRLGWPLVVKPLDGNHGRGVTTGICDEHAVRTAVALAGRISRNVIVEQEMPGHDHRVLVVGGHVVAVAERVPAHVVGDGRRSIADLIEIVNQDSRRGMGHENVLTSIAVDDVMHSWLATRGRSVSDVPAPGEPVYLRGTANLSSGGIVEVNAAPGLRMHLQPSHGAPRDVARPIVDSLFPRGSRSRVPIFAVTGTNGKSTTVRMVSRILCEAGLRVGMTTTSGIYIDGRLQVAADASGPRSARMVLRNPCVDVAVLEAARGGILREGLGFDYCDIGAVLNVTADHLGLNGIDTVEDLARVKSVVSESVGRRGYSVLSADDPRTVAMARHAGGKVVWFTALGGERTPGFVVEHIASGGMAVTLEHGAVTVHRAGSARAIANIVDLPATLGGAAEFNVLNALAATAMTTAHGIDDMTIATALHAFTTSFEDSPGRLNIHDAGGIRVIVDYAHNPAALTALGRLIARLRGDGTRVFGMVSIPGDRRDEDLVEMGVLAAGIFDEIMFREAPDGRGRPAGTINALMSQGALSTGMSAEFVHRLVNEEAATDECLRRAQPGDMVVLMPTDVDGIWQRVQDHFGPDTVGFPTSHPTWRC